jgi:hypothetical protein
MIGYTDAGYLSDPHNARSQTGFGETDADGSRDKKMKKYGSISY